MVLKNESFIVCISSPTYSHIFLSKPLKLWSAQLRSRKRLPRQLLHPPKKSPSWCRPLRSLSLLLLLLWRLLKKIRLLSSWRITSHIWDQSLVLTTGSSTPPEESLVWSSTDELACRSSLSMPVHPLFCSSINLRSFQLLAVSQARIFFHQIQDQMHSCTFAPRPFSLTPVLSS